MRRAVLEISDHLLIEIVKGVEESIHKKSFVVRKYGLPNDCKVIRAFTTINGQGTIGILLESESFDDIKAGEIYPTLPSPELETMEPISIASIPERDGLN
jgi:hypothetical protein